MIVGPALHDEVRRRRRSADRQREAQAEAASERSDFDELERNSTAPDQALQALLGLAVRTPAAIREAAPQRSVAPPQHARDAALEPAAERVARTLPAARNLLERHAEHFRRVPVAAEHLAAERREVAGRVPDEAGRRSTEQVVRDPHGG